MPGGSGYVNAADLAVVAAGWTFDAERITTAVGAIEMVIGDQRVRLDRTGWPTISA